MAGSRLGQAWPAQPPPGAPSCWRSGDVFSERIEHAAAVAVRARVLQGPQANHDDVVPVVDVGARRVSGTPPKTRTPRHGIV